VREWAIEAGHPICLADADQRSVCGDGAADSPQSCIGPDLRKPQFLASEARFLQGHCRPRVSANTNRRVETKFMFDTRVASLLHQRLGYDRLLNGEAPEVVYLDEEGRLFSTPVFDDEIHVLRFKLVSTDMRGATYSLLLHHRDFQFTASYGDGTIVLCENGKVSSDDSALLGKLLHHLETASTRRLVRQPRSNNSLWQRLFDRKRLPKAVT
jgi:hypothetical protein